MFWNVTVLRKCLPSFTDGGRHCTGKAEQYCQTDAPGVVGLIGCDAIKISFLLDRFLAMIDATIFEKKHTRCLRRMRTPNTCVNNACACTTISVSRSVAFRSPQQKIVVKIDDIKIDSWVHECVVTKLRSCFSIASKKAILKLVP